MTSVNKPQTRTMRANRGGLNLALLGAAILGKVGAAAQAAKSALTISPAAAERALVRPYVPGFGAPPDIWGQSDHCRRMVFKNRRARR